MIFKKAAGIIVCCRDSVILCKRISTYKGEKVPYGGYWAPFAGAIEEGETEKKAAIRELKEESGITAKEEEINHLKTFKTKTTSFSLYILETKIFPEIKLCEEHTDVGYFVIEYLLELPSDYKLDPKIIKELQRYKKNLTNKN